MGLHDNKLYYSHNVTYKEDVKFPTGAANYNNAQKYSIPSTGTLGAQDKFKFNNLELFWDYTWPIIPASGTGHAALPPDFDDDDAIDFMMELPDFNIGRHTNAINSGDGVWGTSFAAQLQGDEYNLPRLSGTDTASPSSGTNEYSREYNHDETLDATLPGIGATITPSPYYRNQCMWANDYFVGASTASSTIISSADNPYIDYSSDYAYQTKDYSSLKTSGYNYQRTLTSANLPSGMSVNSGSTNTVISFNNLKWLLLKVKTTIAQPVKASGNSFQIELKGESTNATTAGTLKLGKDYLLFYCEYKSATYIVDTTSGKDYSTWLDVCSKSLPGGTTGVKSMGNAAGLNGNGNGGHQGSGGDTTPNVVDLQKSSIHKYLLLGIGEDVKVSKIKITK